MLLRVKNLGPVREAELDLSKPLIVLPGPNNSGKTFRSGFTNPPP
jgi:predicted ATPase